MKKNKIADSLRNFGSSLIGTSIDEKKTDDNNNNSPPLHNSLEIEIEPNNYIETPPISRSTTTLISNNPNLNLNSKSKSPPKTSEKKYPPLEIEKDPNNYNILNKKK